GQRRYPQEPSPQSTGGEALQAELRALLQSGKPSETVQFILTKFRDAQHAESVDAQGRLVAANAELLALETLGDPDDPLHRQIAERLAQRLVNYKAGVMPSAQRRFLMREMQRLAPDLTFPTLAAEELAARFLEVQSALDFPEQLRSTPLADVWAVSSSGSRALALFSTAGLRLRLADFLREHALPGGIQVAVLPPAEEPSGETALLTHSLAPDLPGWRLALSLDDHAIFDTAADRSVAAYRWTGGAVIAAMTLLAVLIARGFGRQLQLAQLKNDLVATVSHELKTPLTAMRALVETLLETRDFDPATTREYLQLLARENSRLSRLIDNFLTFSRLERNKFSFAFTRLQPAQIATSALAAMGERHLAADCDLQTEIGADLPEIVGDADALITALLNLLDNACKYSGEEKQIALRVAARDGKIRFAVEDRGIGLSPAESRRIFRRFYQVDQRLSRTAGGCGLGLNIVQSIVAAHGGSVKVHSIPGEGSIFSIDLPLADPSSA
ncbi:MAG TPA: HAMP domain-containing sensor histidine kinase, partial [Chthoniobacteraceae bacterium]